MSGTVTAAVSATQLVPRRTRRPRSVLITPEDIQILRAEDLGLARKVQPVRVDVAAHDEWHLTRRKQWKVRLAAAHPDRVQNTIGRWEARQRFQQLQQQFERWMLEEIAWYRVVNLTPPTISGK